MGDVTAAPLQCKDCPNWYGGEDDEYGPCMLKHLREEKRYVTVGYHACDEEEWLEEWTARSGSSEKKTSTSP